jgi:hypothetical protein
MRTKTRMDNTEYPDFPYCKWVKKHAMFCEEESLCLVYQPSYEELLRLFKDYQRAYWRVPEIRHFVELHLWRYGMVDKITETLELLKKDRSDFYGYK